MSSNIIFPQSPFVETGTLRLSREWQEWLLNPTFLTVKFSEALGVEYGGLGQPTDPTLNWILIGTGDAYSPSQYLPVSAFPGLTGDVLANQGAVATTLATVNASPGTFGDGANVSVVTVNEKGLSTLVTTTPITGSPGAFAAGGTITAPSATISGPLGAGAITGTSITASAALTGATVTAVGGFGCNGQSAQTSVSAGAAVSTTASTNVTPFGYTTAAQADRIVALLNTIRTALISNGILAP